MSTPTLPELPDGLFWRFALVPREPFGMAEHYELQIVSTREKVHVVRRASWWRNEKTETTTTDVVHAGHVFLDATGTNYAHTVSGDDLAEMAPSVVEKWEGKQAAKSKHKAVRVNERSKFAEIINNGW